MERRMILLVVVLSLASVGCDKAFIPISDFGIIKKADNENFQYGTHVLIDEYGDLVYALRSDKVDLNKLKDKRVKIIGRPILGYPRMNGPVFLEVSYMKEEN